MLGVAANERLLGQPGANHGRHDDQAHDGCVAGSEVCGQRDWWHQTAHLHTPAGSLKRTSTTRTSTLMMIHSMKKCCLVLNRFCSQHNRARNNPLAAERATSLRPSRVHVTTLLLMRPPFGASLVRGASPRISGEGFAIYTIKQCISSNRYQVIDTLL